MTTMNWSDLLNSARLGKPISGAPERGRSPFTSDVDRIIFSGAFRRLNKKTQVHPLVSNDHVHTRLTHSLEVASVGRTLGTLVGERLADQFVGVCASRDLGDIVAASCLAHDIGNPPFGHAGESAIRAWFCDHETGGRLLGKMRHEQRREFELFEGNAQGFRRIAQVENHTFSGGLRLTYATLATFMKYPWTVKDHIAAEKEKYSCFLTELDVFEQVAAQTGLIKMGTTQRCRHPLAYLMEAADDICYATVDLEDAVELKIITYTQAEQELLPACSVSDMPEIDARAGYRLNLARIRGKVYDAVINKIADNFAASSNAMLRGEPVELFDPADTQLAAIRRAKEFAAEHIFPDSKKLEIELGAYSCMNVLLEAFCAAAVEFSKREVSSKSKLVLRLLGDHSPLNAPPPGGEWNEYQTLRRVVDYISGMTDNYATYMAKQLMGMGMSGVQRP